MTPASQPGGPDTPVGEGPEAARWRDIAILWVGSLAFALSFQLLTTVLPLRALDLRASGLEIGLITGVFAGTSLLARPVIGWRLDRGRRLPLVLLGALIFAAASFSYSLVLTVAALLVLRAAHGLGMAAQVTASQTLIVDLAPPASRGSVLGLLGTTPAVGMAIGPVVGATLLAAAGYDPVFYISSALALLALLILVLVREPSRALNSAGRAPWRTIHPAVVWPGVSLVALQFGFGATITFVPLLALERDLANAGLFFTCYAIAMVAGQFIGGRLSDRTSRIAAIVPGLVIASAGLVALAVASGSMLLAAGVLFGLGLGTAQPALFALGGDLAPPSERGTAMASLGIFMELGIGGGGTVTGILSSVVGLGPAFVVAAGVALAGAAVAYARRAEFAPRARAI